MLQCFPPISLFFVIPLATHLVNKWALNPFLAVIISYIPLFIFLLYLENEYTRKSIASSWAKIKLSKTKEEL